jgi:D-alanine transaminase
MKSKPTFPSFVYLNGEIIQSESATISVFDRGFLFGDGVYEVMAKIGDHFFYQDAHINRLKRSLRELHIEYDVTQLTLQIPKLLEVSGLSGSDCLLYIQITRGVAPRQHAYPNESTPTVLMYAWPKALPEINAELARVVIREDFRWMRSDIKSTSLLGNIMANQFASEQGCYETLFTRNGLFTEASHCNVFFVRDETVYTHPANNFILDGITRIAVLELCKKLNIPIVLEGYPVSKLQRLDEAFLTGTSTQIMSISEIDGDTLNLKSPGPITQALQEAFKLLKDKQSQC